MLSVNWRNLDFSLLLGVAILIIFGAVMIRSAVAGNIELLELNIVGRQLIFAAVGAVAIILMAAIDYRLWSSLSRVLYVVAFIALAALYIIGGAVFGSARWFDTGVILIQPSEIAKIVMILILGDFFARNQHNIETLRGIFVSLALTMGIVIWILLQPNLSTSIVIMAIWASMLWASGLKIKYVLYAAGAGLLALLIGLPLLFQIIINPDLVGEDGIIKPYQIQRITNFIAPDPNASYGETFNIEQAKISVGSGGWVGQGYGQGTQIQNRFLKVRQTDFIFAAAAQEFGFIGSTTIILLEFFVVWRCMRIAQQARDTYGALIAIGVGVIIAFQTIVNVGMNINLLPVTGLPLPFVSYGGSSLLSKMIGIGLVQSVALRHNTLDF